MKLFSKIIQIIRFNLYSLFILVCANIHAQNFNNFTHLSVNDGLSQSTIFSIYQDSKGFMWFGTRGGGLNKYNGYDFNVYRNHPGDPHSISDNTILCIYEDSDQVLWVGTEAGYIDRFDLNSGSFHSYPLHLSNEVNLDMSLRVRCIFEDHSKKLWVGTNQRVYSYNKERDTFEQMMEDSPFPLKGVTSICEDTEGYFYFATWDRLIRYHPEKGSYDQLTYPVDPYADFGGKIYPLHLDKNNKLWFGLPGGLKVVDIEKGFTFSNSIIKKVEWPSSFNYVRTIKETRDGMLWFGTEDGLYAYDSEKSRLNEYKTQPNNPESLNHNSIYSLFEDNVGTLWIGTWSGLSILDKRNYRFKHYFHLHNDPNSLSNNVVSSFQEDKFGTWIGTEQGGLNYLNKERTNFTAYNYNDNDTWSLPSNNVKSILLDSNDDLWVGTFNGGLSLHLGGGRFRNYLEGQSIYSIIEQPKGKLYCGGRQGLKVMYLAGRTISDQVFHPSIGKTSIESPIITLFSDSKNRIWIGTRHEGLYLYDLAQSTLRNFRTDVNDLNTISSDYIISICEDAEKNIWIGTHAGLNRFNESANDFYRMNEEVGIYDRVITGLVADDNGNLWISTYNGLYVYDQSENDLRHFNHLDGLQSNEFNRGAYYKNSSGELFFGGVKGFNVFHPDDIKKNTMVPPVIITDFKISNKSVIPNEKNSPLTKHISETNKIVLSHKQSSFSFDFVALNYLISEKNSYAYMLEGYNEDWNYVGGERTASYMNLEPGKYTFHVKASNNDNVWNEKGASVYIHVMAPFYATPVAIVLYTIILAGLLYSLVQIVKYRTKKDNELRIERAEKIKIRELNANRLQFFTNISHEFRTPLTLIAGPLDKILSGKYVQQSDYLLQLMKSNVNRMLRLVNQLMDFRKLEDEKMPLKVKKYELEKFLSQIVLGFEDLANTKMIELNFFSTNSSPDNTEQWFDRGILDKVIYNLLSNAFKFTPENGIVQVNLNIVDKSARIEVSDTGKGIKQEKVQRIFERFYSDSPDYGSSGIGLSLSKKLIDLHRGTIEVDSECGHGTKFTVTIPISKEAFSDEELFYDEVSFIPDRPQLDSKISWATLTDSELETGHKRELILIVEDNPDMASYLKNHFSDYKVIMAENGEVGFKLAKDQIPDIIISDIMMPRMNGIELCKVVKKEYLTSHIPVILLTAKAAIDEKVEGLENTGADAYIEKPFDPDYLSVLVKNTLLQRKKLIDKYVGLATERIKSTESTDEDTLFLQKINKIVNDHISDPYFAVDQLLLEIHMSRSQLYRKFKTVSDKSPSEYIRILRLQYASDLLKSNDKTISEVAYMAGFGSASYFDTCFKKHFGVSPGKYITES